MVTNDMITALQRQAEKSKSETDRLAYINPDLANTAREEGNVAFKVRYRAPLPLSFRDAGRGA